MITTKGTKLRGSASTDVRSNIGQLLIIGFDGTEMAAGLASLLRQIQPAGVILFARNIVSASQTYKLLKDCQRRKLRSRFFVAWTWKAAKLTA